ncbi:glycosyltransferase family 4 protein [Halochromatium glycolicum]|uniref:Uncharacterized protein n=1 Tax=Halochromatium glycolicum TaxID=85075 RepID=A0AAJ0U544_9GAMM|nr:glycosyltransferase family 4 protein [Halochromatium glycolicum]MBK1705435.1 hypothetical protein [Halochromatium glycolicum]
MEGCVIPVRRLRVLVPGDLGARTGGYRYDRRLIRGLCELGWTVRVTRLDDSFPVPTADALTEAATRLAELDPGELVLIDGLALGVMPELVAAHRERLRILALVHHPLADEAGLTPERAAALRASEQAALASVHRIVVTSAATARRLTAMGQDADRIDVIEPGTDPASLAARTGLPPLQLLCVGTLIPRKGHRFLIEALARLRDERWHLTIVGSLARDPETAARTRVLIDSLGLHERITLAGELNDTALEQAYQEADLFVLPSLYEGYGMAFAEALARGLPILGSGAGAVHETVPPQAGLLVEPGSSEALTAALRELLHDRERLTGLAAGAEQARKRLPDWPSCIRRWSALLEHV